MITNDRHKGLRQFYESGSKAGIQAQHAERLRLILARLDSSREPQDMNLPGLRLHSVSVSGNWRVIFRFDGQDACDVDYRDYH